MAWNKLTSWIWTNKLIKLRIARIYNLTFSLALETRLVDVRLSTVSPVPWFWTLWQAVVETNHSKQIVACHDAWKQQSSQPIALFSLAFSAWTGSNCSKSQACFLSCYLSCFSLELQGEMGAFYKWNRKIRMHLNVGDRTQGTAFSTLGLGACVWVRPLGHFVPPRPLRWLVCFGWIIVSGQWTLCLWRRRGHHAPLARPSSRTQQDSEMLPCTIQFSVVWLK